jgi:hypothetical protein
MVNLGHKVITIAELVQIMFKDEKFLRPIWRLA